MTTAQLSLKINELLWSPYHYEMKPCSFLFWRKIYFNNLSVTDIEQGVKWHVSSCFYIHVSKIYSGLLQAKMFIVDDSSFLERF